MGKTRSAGSVGDELGQFPELNRPGVTVQGTAVLLPSQGLPPGVRVAVTSKSAKRAQAVARQLNASRHQLSAAKSRYYLGMTLTISPAYKAMWPWYRYYRIDSLVRGCINALAYWSTKEGFDTVIEPIGEGLTPEQEQQIIKQYLSLKYYIDRANQRVNLDWVLRSAIIKAKIWGKAGFEIELDEKQAPSRLISLPMWNQWDLRPHVDEDWVLQGFWWRGQIDFYKPNELLYFINSAFESDYEGLSDVEPILDDLDTRAKIRADDLKEAATTLWAGVAIHSLDVDRLPAGLTQADIQDIIDEHVAALRPGKHITTDNRWEITVVDLKPNLEQLVKVKDAIDQEVIGNFQVPKFIINRTEAVNRATSYSQLEAFVDGPITDIQRWIGRTVEAQWYDQLTRKFLEIPEGQDLPVRVKHRWREIRTADFFQLMNAVATAFADGMIDQPKAYELMRDGQGATFDPAELKQLEEGPG